MPVLIYFVSVVLLYFICFYLLPKNTTLMAFIGFLIIYVYIYIGVPVLGFCFGKVIVKRMSNIRIFVCIVYAVITFALMLLASSMKYIFWDYMYFNYPFQLSTFVEGMSTKECMYVSIGSMISFSVGEIVQYFNDK